jgi:hypothetical protein
MPLGFPLSSCPTGSVRISPHEPVGSGLRPIAQPQEASALSVARNGSGGTARSLRSIPCTDAG